MHVVEKYKVTTFCAPPTIYRFLIKEDLKQYDLSHLKYCVVAGEPLNPEVYKQFMMQRKRKLMEGYGQTELTVTLATYPGLSPKPGRWGNLRRDMTSICSMLMEIHVKLENSGIRRSHE